MGDGHLSGKRVWQGKGNQAVIRLDHTIIRTRDGIASARFFADVLGLAVDERPEALFAGVRVNDELTVYFSTSRQVLPNHYAFRVDEAAFGEIFARIQAAGISFGSGPFKPNLHDGRIAQEGGRRHVYFEDPNGHVLEVLTG